MAVLPPLPAAAARLQALSAIRAKCATPPSSATPLITSRRQALLTHYPPDVDVVKLAAQDHKLASVGLIDTWKHVMEQREKAMALLVTGMAKGPEGGSGKKKKKRK
ncbi:hypothetical protein HDU86_005133 [Geranomyces michiganensis]|nr:hypothetical protein HDU86_005133 [Geranomyces michiganensis]